MAALGCREERMVIGIGIIVFVLSLAAVFMSVGVFFQLSEKYRPSDKYIAGTEHDYKIYAIFSPIILICCMFGIGHYLATKYQATTLLINVVMVIGWLITILAAILYYEVSVGSYAT